MATPVARIKGRPHSGSVRIPRVLIATLLVALAAAAPADAARHVIGRAVKGVAMHHRVHDVVLAPGAGRVRASAANTKVFQDAQGHAIHISTSVPGLALEPYAGLLAGIPLHGAEIQHLAVEVVAPDKIGAICGSSDAAACYGPDAPGRSPAGHMFLPSSDPDLVHIVVHEYGHHMDNQLLNLAGLGYGCDVDGDGSRRWFFARDVGDAIVDRGYDCSPSTPWDHLLPELFAEDCTRANGRTGWVMPVRPPSPSVLRAMRDDVARPFRRHVSLGRISVPGRGEFRHRLTVGDWTAIGVRLSVPRGRDFDLFIYEPGQRRPLIKSTHTGSAEERIGGAFFAPGAYTLVVRSRGRGGTSRLKLALR
jgi:hypothetical protein